MKILKLENNEPFFYLEIYTDSRSIRTALTSKLRARPSFAIFEL